MQQFDGMNHKLYQLPDPTVSTQASNKGYVDKHINEHAHSGIPWKSTTGLPAYNRKVWSASSPGSSVFTPYTADGDGSTSGGANKLVKDTTSFRFYYPEVHSGDFSGNGCIAFSMVNGNMDKLMAVFQILWVSSSSSNNYTQVRVCHLWNPYPDTMRWKYNLNQGENFNSSELRWGYMMVTAGGYWGPR